MGFLAAVGWHPTLLQVRRANKFVAPASFRAYEEICVAHCKAVLAHGSKSRARLLSRRCWGLKDGHEA